MRDQSLQRPRLLCVLDHPTQYDGPIWRALVARGNLEPVVWYRDTCVPPDGEVLGRNVGWRPSLAGFEVRQVRNASLLSAFRGQRTAPAAILTDGWTRSRAWLTLTAALARGWRTICPTDRIAGHPRIADFGRANDLLHATRSRLFDGFFTTGLLGKRYLESLGVSSERIAVGLYPVDVMYWRDLMAAAVPRAAIHACYGWRDPNLFTVLAVSKMSKREAPLFLLEVFRQFNVLAPGSRLLWVGDGPLRPAVATRIAEAGLGGCVALPGYVPYGDLAAYYGAADVMLHAPEVEPWGISVLEALACGVPVVASENVGAAADVALSEHEGVALAKRAPEALAGALAEVANQKQASREPSLASAQARSAAAAAEQLEQIVARLSGALTQ